MKKVFLLLSLIVVLLGAMAQKKSDKAYSGFRLNHLIYFLQKNDIVFEYKPVKFLDNEEDYMLYEDVLEKGINGTTYCENTGKLYLLEGDNIVVEYDIDAIKNQKEVKRIIPLTFNVGKTPSLGYKYIEKDFSKENMELYWDMVSIEPIIEVSPDGKYLALEEENHLKLHIIDILSGNEVMSVELGKKFDNYLLDYYGGKRQKYDVGCPYAFQSDDEILVSGARKAMIVNITTGTKTNISWSKKDLGLSNKQIPCVLSVTQSGFISGSKSSTESTFSIEVIEGKLRLTSQKEVYYTGSFKYNDRYNWNDNDNHYHFKICKRWGDQGIGIAADEPYYKGNVSVYSVLMFKDTRRASFLSGTAGNGYFYVYGPNKLQIFNHELTTDEIEKRRIISINYREGIDQEIEYLWYHPDSKYKKIVQRNLKNDICSIYLRKFRKVSDHTLAHINELEQFIDKYARYDDSIGGGVYQAREELKDTYYKLYEEHKKGGTRSIEEYIANYPRSPYIAQARQELRSNYKLAYEALSKETSSQPYLDYIKKYPNSPYIADVKERARVIQEREKAAALAEKQRQEEAALAEKQRKEAAALAEKQRLEAEKKRKEEEQIAEQKRKEAERERQIAANSKVSTWKLGNKLCNCQKNHIMVILDSWNENKSSFKGQILTSDVSYFEGQNMKKGSILWFETKGWHKCLEDEIEYCTKHDVSNSSKPATTSSTTKVGPPLTKGTEVHRSWTYKSKSWALAREKEGTRVVTGVIEEWNEDYTMAKIKITYLYDSEHSNPYYLYDNVSTDKYYVGETYWVRKGWWK